MNLFEAITEWFCNNIVWGTPMVVFIFGAGIFLSYKLDFLQITHLPLIFKNTVATLFKKGDKNKSEKGISQLGVISTALAATIGTGNIAGVATAIAIGGAGAIFWMWVSAIFSMATAYSENLLGVYYRQKNKKGEFVGGAMYYIKNGLKGRRFLGVLAVPLAFLFACFCLFSSLGMGNMIQVNTVAELFKNKVLGISLPPIITAVILSGFVGFAIFGGAKRICKITEKLVPFMAFIYVFGSLLVIAVNFKNLHNAVISVFKGAFGVGALLGGFSGYGVKIALNTGLKRGIFSNEAGLGSATLIGACSEVKEPAVQGMWGIFTVFFDTIIGCTLTAFAILTSGVQASENNMGLLLVTEAFSKSLGSGAGELVSVLTLLFALSTIIGWSFYGIKAAEYLLGERFIWIYKILFTLAVFPGALLNLKTVWTLADIFNGLMAVPNLIGVLALTKQVISVTNNYKERVFKNKDYIPPMISAPLKNEKQKTPSAKAKSVLKDFKLF
ncbi:MAG: sodium:alanine symporter family protein [Clostridia bacterium]|nr:sodium:alanine symporter family protein [Clostridia bacterium]MBQ9919980.1 sodium:alanine symporter family protein [Clostridia bacterium]